MSGTIENLPRPISLISITCFFKSLLFDNIMESGLIGLLKVSLICITHELNIPSTKFPPSGKKSMLIFDESENSGSNPESMLIIEIGKHRRIIFI